MTTETTEHSTGPSAGALVRWAGAALAAGGALTALLNVVLTPFLPQHAPFARVAASLPFLLRQSLSACAAALLLLGSVGVHLAQRNRAGGAGTAAFALAFLGSALLLATEWTEVFMVRTLALRAPDVLKALESATTPTLYDLGSMAALAVFTLGWLALALTALRSRAVPRAGPILVVAGLFAVPLLGAVAKSWGAIAGNVVLGAGWFLMGGGLRRGAGG